MLDVEVQVAWPTMKVGTTALKSGRALLALLQRPASEFADGRVEQFLAGRQVEHEFVVARVRDRR